MVKLLLVEFRLSAKVIITLSSSASWLRLEMAMELLPLTVKSLAVKAVPSLSATAMLKSKTMLACPFFQLETVKVGCELLPVAKAVAAGPRLEKMTTKETKTLARRRSLVLNDGE